MAAVGLSAASAVAFALATRPGPLGFVSLFAATALHAAVGACDRRSHAFLLTAVAATGPASVAVSPLAPLHPWGAAGFMLVLAASFGVVGIVAVQGPARRRRATVATIWRAASMTIGWCAVEAAWASPGLLGSFALPVLAVGTALSEGPARSLAAWLGPIGLSGFVLGVGAVAAPLARSGRRWAATAWGLLAVASWSALPAGMGDASPGEVLALDDPGSDHVRVRLVQHVPTPPGIAAARFDPGEHPRSHAPLFDALRAADGRLVVWPEGSWPRPIDLREDATSDGVHRDAEATLLAVVPDDVSLLLGAATLGGDGLRNSVLLVQRGSVERVADKVRPVPLTESHLVAGSPGAVAVWRGTPFAAAVCWDAVFPGVARAAARAGARFLVLVANDAYAGRGPVAALHLRQARLRAIETGLPVLFVQATGPSAAIDASGRLVAVLPAGARGYLDVDLPLPPASSVGKGGGA